LAAQGALSSGADRVNALRRQAGLAPLAPQAQLAEAARLHAGYLDRNLQDGQARHGVSVHAELGYRPGFSGATVKQRAVNAGYPHDRVIENVTVGYQDVTAAIDGLMSAIYHRLAFLDLTVDEMGVAGQGKAHVFVMGRSDIRELCRESPAEALMRPAVDCLGTRVTQDYLARICANLPAGAKFSSPWPEACPNGARLDADFMTRFCTAPPSAALDLRSGRYYDLCYGRLQVDADWLEALCAAPPAIAAYPFSGSYYEICAPKVAVYAEWLEQACAGAGPGDLYRDSGRYQRVCDERPVEVRSEYLGELAGQRYRAAPRYVVWPPDRSSEIPPAFFEEQPDPLPDRQVSGYPVSIQFNPGWANEIQLRDFALFENLDGEWQRLNNTRLLSAGSDPNGRLDKGQFALFSLDRLRWDREYLAVMLAEVNGKTEQIEWSFTTQRPAERLVELGHSDQTLVLAGDKDTALYLPPTAAKPHTVTALRSRYNSATLLKLWAIDANTLGVRIGGQSCRPVYIELEDGPELKLIREGCTQVSKSSDVPF
jgi:hypothetical protein